MSFVRLDSGEFPPLGQSNLAETKSGASQKHKFCHVRENSDEDAGFRSTSSSPARKQQKSDPKLLDKTAAKADTSLNEFTRCRVGLVPEQCDQDLEHVLRLNQVGHHADFIVTPVAPIRDLQYGREFEVISDLVLTTDEWQTRVVVDMGPANLDPADLERSRHFDKLLQHAFYLGTPAVIISCPDSDPAYVQLASIVNRRLANLKGPTIVLFEVCLSVPKAHEIHPWRRVVVRHKKPQNISSSTNSDAWSESSNSFETSSAGWGLRSSPNQSRIEPDQSAHGDSSDSQCSGVDPWTRWNNLRGHLRPDSRVGVCLSIRDELSEPDTDLARWQGEPVRMITVHTDRFLRTRDGRLRMDMRCHQFAKKILLANSMKTSFVLKSTGVGNVREYLACLNAILDTTITHNPDPLRDWNDRMQCPLQPLSSNLDSGTYSVFESDSIKYTRYEQAMTEAIKSLARGKTRDDFSKPVVVMVLGAGRGPLVDSFIRAIKTANTEQKFRIFALDKNPSSVMALKYKQRNKWVDSSDTWVTQVVEADMREWKPAFKADIIASELLGSLSDNELSPECLDGTWKLSRPDTICIPQEYSSYLAPICSYKLRQELQRLEDLDSNTYDQIYVVRLSNQFTISEPQELFTFEHRDLSLEPSQRCNERFARLIFWSTVDTVCHGFAGYFSAKLFADVSLSTVPNKKTTSMESWFPAFVPLDNPIQMPRGTRLELLFWRKESSSSVWYEWAVTHPVRSRIHSQSGQGSSMSKFI